MSRLYKVDIVEIETDTGAAELKETLYVYNEPNPRNRGTIGKVTIQRPGKKDFTYRPPSRISVTLTEWWRIRRGLAYILNSALLKTLDKHD